MAFSTPQLTPAQAGPVNIKLEPDPTLLLQVFKANKQSPLLRLPGEIRNMIYGLTLSGNHISMKFPKSDRGSDTRTMSHRRKASPFSFLLVCRQIYVENRLQPVSGNTIYCEDIGYIIRAARDLQPFQRDLINSIDLYALEPTDKWANMTMATLREDYVPDFFITQETTFALKNLRRVRIFVGVRSYPFRVQSIVSQLQRIFEAQKGPDKIVFHFVIIDIRKRQMLSIKDMIARMEKPFKVMILDIHE